MVQNKFKLSVMKKSLMFFYFATVVLFACNQSTQTSSPDPAFVARMDSVGNLAKNFPGPDTFVVSPAVKKLVTFILDPKNSARFSSQKFYDSGKSVDVVSIVGNTVYTLYYSDGVYLSISARPNRKKFSAMERFACADEHLDGAPDFGFIGDPTTPKKYTKYFAATNMFASSDETMVLDNRAYWQKVYGTSLKEIVAYYKL